MSIEMLLKPLICIIYTKLLKAIFLQLEHENITIDKTLQSLTNKHKLCTLNDSNP